MIHIHEQAYTESYVGYPWIWIWIDWLTSFLFKDKLTQKPEKTICYAERMIDCTSDTICGLTGVETELNLNDRSLTIRMSVLPLHYTTIICIYIKREKLIQAWYWTSLLYSLLGSMRKLRLLSCSTLSSVRPSIRSIGSSWLLYLINYYNYLYIQISNAFLRVWLPVSLAPAFVSLKDIRTLSDSIHS